MKFRYSRHSGYECSSKGDKRFSALFAIMADGRTLEMHYQLDSELGKGWNPGGRNWMIGKGRPAKVYKTREALWEGYYTLWKIWSKANPHLMLELRCRALEHNGVIRDSFATTEINQARALAQLLREEDENSTIDPTDAY